MPAKNHELAPRPATLIESMRDIGYSFEAALADLIDNSISAGASQVAIRLPAADTAEPWVAVLDNGGGMSEQDLHEAMRPGSASPNVTRGLDDLGRFGLGLKTASFSQCRRLTVLSSKDGQIAGRRWDLDVVADTNRWLVEELSSDEVDSLPATMTLRKQPSGTLVLWERMDRLGGLGASRMQLLRQHMDLTRHHLALVFHRFLAGEGVRRKVTLLTNEVPIEAFDPFAVGLSEPLELTKIPMGDAWITVQPYKLPHHSRVEPAVWDRLASAEGYVRSQGFYVYRNRRLIIHGTWFRLARQTELTKLLRVKVDIPNSLDHLWQIDVRKSRANPPEVVRQRLKEIIDRILDSGSRIYTGRAATSISRAAVPLWSRLAGQGRVWYGINRDHPLLSGLSRGMDSEQRHLLVDLVEAVESSLPVDAIFADAGGNQRHLRQDDADRHRIGRLAAQVVELLREDGIAEHELATKLLMIEPFASHAAATRDILHEWGLVK
jgi:hypothetical protein